MATLQELAREAYDAFESAERPNGDTFYRVQHGAPQWVSDLTREAHDGGEILPDDWRYECVMDACSYLADAEGEPDDWAHEFADGKIDVYTAARFDWLASSLRRQGYCDEAVSEGLVDEGASLEHRVGVGQYEEASEVFHAVRAYLETMADED